MGFFAKRLLRAFTETIQVKTNNKLLTAGLNQTDILISFDLSEEYEASVSQSVNSVTQSCPTLCNLMDCSTPGLLVHHQLPEFTQTHVHQVSDAIQPPHPLSSPFPPAFSLSQHQGLFHEACC